MSKRNSRHSIGPFHIGMRRDSFSRMRVGSFMSGDSTRILPLLAPDFTYIDRLAGIELRGQPLAHFHSRCRVAVAYQIQRLYSLSSKMAFQQVRYGPRRVTNMDAVGKIIGATFACPHLSQQHIPTGAIDPRAPQRGVWQAAGLQQLFRFQ